MPWLSRSSQFMQKAFIILASVLSLCLFTACGGKKKEITQLEQLQMNSYYETAKREIFIKNYAAAEKALVEITKIDDTNYSVWRDIGMLRVRLNKNSDARDAYKKALSASEAAFKKDVNDQGAFITRLQTLIFLGRAQDARDVLAKAAKDNPTIAAYQELNKQKAVDKLLDDPQIKDGIAK